MMTWDWLTVSGSSSYQGLMTTTILGKEILSDTIGTKPDSHTEVALNKKALPVGKVSLILNHTIKSEEICYLQDVWRPSGPKLMGSRKGHYSCTKAQQPLRLAAISWWVGKVMARLLEGLQRLGTASLPLLATCQLVGGKKWWLLLKALTLS